MALDTHTLMGLGGVDIIDRLSKIEIIIKKFFLKVRYWIVNVPTVGWSVECCWSSAVKTVLLKVTVLALTVFRGESAPGSSGVHY